MERSLRRHQNTLIIEGIGILALGIWSVLRSVMTMFFIPGHYAYDGQDSIFMAVASTVILSGIDLLMRYYICRSAIKEANGQRRSRLYLVFSVLICIPGLLLIFIVVAAFTTGLWQDAHIVRMIVTALIELTAIIIVVDFIRSAVLVRRQR